MPSTPSESLRLEKQAVGEKLNLWGDDLNRVIEGVEQSIAGILFKPLTGDVRLTTELYVEDEARNAGLVFTDGGLTAAPTVTIPAVPKLYHVENRGSAFPIIFDCGGITSALDTGRKGVLLCNGVDVWIVDPVNDAQEFLRAAEAARDLAKAWAISDTSPDGSGEKSSKSNAIDSATSASAAASSAGASSGFSSMAGQRASYAREWAIKSVDVPVSEDAGAVGTQFSSLHWATKSAVSAQSASDSVVEIEGRLEEAMQRYEDGPVATVNGRTGNVTGLAEQADVDAAIAAEAEARQDAIAAVPQRPLIFPFSITSPSDGDFLGASNYTFEAEPFLSLYGARQASNRVRFYAPADPDTVIDSVEILGTGNTVPVNLGNTVLVEDTPYVVDMVYADEIGEERVSENRVSFTTPIAYEYGKYLAIAHDSSPYLTTYGQDVDTFDGLPNPSTLPSFTGYGAAFSSDGTYLAVTHDSTPYLTIYKRSGDTFTKLPNPSTLPSGSGRGVSFSSDGVYLAVAHFGNPYLTIYKRSGDTFTKLPNPSTLPPDVGLGVAFSSDGTYLAVTHDSTPYLTIYKRSGDTFTKLPNPSTLPSFTGYGAAFSSDGVYLAVAHHGSPNLTIYKRSGDTFTKLPNPSTLPPDIGYGVAFSSDGTYLAVAHDGSPNLTIYKRSGDTFTKLPNPSTLPPSVSNDVAFSSDDTYLAVAHFSSPYLTIFKRSGDTFTKLSNPSTLPSGSGRGVAFYPSALYGEVTS